MKRIALFAALAALAAVPAWAQSEKHTAPLKLPAKAEAKADAKAGPKTEIKPLVRRLTAKSFEDARECLNRKTNEEIIICAEKFL
ncbi:MAG: hypothetical protein ACREUK_06350 [Burkholderiales bacterium]